MVLTVSFVLSSVIGLCCHRRQADTSTRLERQRRGVKTTRLRRPRDVPFVLTHTRVHRIPLPNVRDDRETPLLWDGTAGLMDLIWVKREAIYFCGKGWTGPLENCPSGKSVDPSIVNNGLKTKIWRAISVGKARV
jgi:hypothetical protein